MSNNKTSLVIKFKKPTHSYWFNAMRESEPILKESSSPHNCPEQGPHILFVEHHYSDFYGTVNKIPTKYNMLM